jgi:predicted RNase H-like nuclease (RuvC/YqgF family)
LRREGATKEAELSFLEREEKQTPDAAEALEKLKREIVQIKHKLEFFNKQYMALAIQAEDIGQYSADLVRRQDELVGLTRVVNELGLLLERRHTQARLNLSQMHIVARPHVPGYDEDD